MVRFYIILKGAVDIFKPKDSTQIADVSLRQITEQISYDNLVAREEEVSLPSPKKVSQQFRRMSVHRKNSVFHFPLEQILEKDDEEQIFNDLHVKLVTIRTGGSFGELALTFNKPRFATARIALDEHSSRYLRKMRKSLCLPDASSLPVTYMATLNKESYNKINSFQKEQMNMKVHALAQVFPKVPTNTLMRIGYNLVQSFYSKNHVLYRQGDATDSFYIIFDGEVQLLRHFEREEVQTIANPLLSRQKRRAVVRKPISLLGKGAVLGVQEIFDKAPRQYTAVCVSHRAVLYQCLTANFKDLLQDRSKLSQLIDLEQDFLRSQQVQLKKKQDKLNSKGKLNYRCMLEFEDHNPSRNPPSKAIHGSQVSLTQIG